MWRWNDKLRPLELSEIEKQGHKMLVAACLAHENTRHLSREEAASFNSRIIRGGLADYFYRLVITDIKPPVFYKIRSNPEHYRQLTDYVISRMEPVLSPLPDFWRFAKTWYADNEPSPERDILTASHLYASRWEFNLIKKLNDFDEEMPGIAQSFEDGLEPYKKYAAVPELLDSTHAFGRFASLCGHLRFQIRWTQIPRIPPTSVLGHMFIVAAYAYIYSLELGFGAERSNNNFFSGLFHDFPEVLTRDIISPVKKSYEGLARLIREYENEELNRRVLEPLRNGGMESLAERLEWYLGLASDTEFEQCCRIGGKVLKKESIEALSGFDRPGTDARDGQLVKACDLLAAFLEAHNSLRNGAAAPGLVEGRARLKQELANRAPAVLDINALLADFE